MLAAIVICAIAATAAALHPAPTQYFQQTIDHFQPLLSQSTFAQRYWVNSSFWDQRPQSPIFLCVGGEGPPLTGWAVVSSIHCNDMVELAPDHNALLVALEHRFYGDSQPTNYDFSLESLRLLSSKQALYDLASFQDFIVQKYGLSTSNRWVSWGGSYPGMLSGWLRLKFPDRIFAAVSSSSPLQAQVDNDGYNDVVSQAMQNEAVGGSEECRSIIAQGHEDIGNMLKTNEGRDILFELFNIDGESSDVLLASENQATWAGQGVIELPVQENDPSCTEYACNIESVCSILQQNDQMTYVERLAKLSAYQNDGGKISIDFNDELNALSQVNNSDRVWLYQTCNEFGFYQTCEKNSDCIYTKGLNNVKYNLLICEYAFDISLEQVYENVERTNEYYGGNKPAGSRILFPNGEVDPWHALGVLNSPDNVSEPTLWVKSASHHFWTHPMEDVVQSEVLQAKQLIWKQVNEWLWSE